MMRLSRPLRLKNVIVALENDHEEIRRQLLILRMQILRSDYEGTEKRAMDLEGFLRQHCIDEESRVLKALTEVCGSREAAEAAVVFQQHQETSVLLGKMQHSSQSSPEKYLSDFLRLEKILTDHMKEEEEHIFPPLMDTIELLT